ncbi:MAG: C_GCAxxG_C_C family protein [Mariniphaga sp.]|nr:C_GCAxxG_C_C family protein [Mariniphaga sp.]
MKLPLSTKQELIDKALRFFDEGYACSQSVLLAYSGQFGLDENAAKLISSTFGGGMGRLREKCGAVTGGFMVLGLAYGNTDPKDMDTKLAAYNKVQELNRQFEAINGTSVCAELLNNHATEDEVARRVHHRLICRKVIADSTAIVYDLIPHETKK